MILVRMHELGDCRIDLDVDRSVLADRDLAFGYDLRRLLWMESPPLHHGPRASPIAPAGIPRIVAGKPPVAWAVEPIPAAERIPALGMGGAGDFVFHLGIGHGR